MIFFWPLLSDHQATFPVGNRLGNSCLASRVLVLPEVGAKFLAGKDLVSGKYSV